MKTELPEYDNSPMRQLIMEKIHRQLNRQILFDRLCNEMSYADLAAKYNVSKSTVTRVLRKGRERLFG
ncbi:MAG: sigma-70 family RNA polymerase sigma factor [Oscillospiraceae bacterium]|nr:sigma-70 family RNA polymerase sigma factor [Oscillospiraceae bacterium]